MTCEIPTPAAIRAARVESGLTQSQSAARVCVTLRNWQQWEAGERKMHPGLWMRFTDLLARTEPSPSPASPP